LAHALRLFGTKRVMPERVILQKRLAACNAAGRLIHCFDRISADGPDRLVTVRAKVSPGLRFEEGLCLVKAVPFRDCHALGWGWSVQADNLSAACAAVPAKIDNTTVYRVFITPSTCRRTPASGGARTMLRCVRQQPARGRLFDAPLPSAHDEAARAHFAPLPELFRRRASE